MVLALFKSAAEKIDKMQVDHWQYWKNPPADKIRWVEEGIQNEEFYFLELQEGDSIGMVRVLDRDELYWGKREERAKYVHSLVIQEKFNGRGYGRQVLNLIEEMAREDDCTCVRLDADAANSKLCKYYEKQGFRRVGIKTTALSSNYLYERQLM